MIKPRTTLSSFLLVFLAGLLAISPALCDHAFAYQAKWVERTISQKEFEQRFGGKNEEITLEEAKDYLFQLVNEERTKRNLKEVSLDALAEELAEEHARQMATYRFISHLDLDGNKPFRRYNLAGGTKHVSENVSYWECGLRGYLTKKLVLDIHKRWMQSEPHRKNILNPTHTHLGIGIEIVFDGKRTVVAAVEEFVDDYGDFSKVPNWVTRNEIFTLSGTIKDGYKFLSVLVGYEEKTEPKSPEELNTELNSYSLPEPTAVIVPEEARGARVDELPTFAVAKVDRSGKNFSVEISLARLFPAQSKQDAFSSRSEGSPSLNPPPGYYYFMVIVEGKDGKPFIASTQTVELK